MTEPFSKDTSPNPNLSTNGSSVGHTSSHMGQFFSDRKTLSSVSPLSPPLTREGKPAILQRFYDLPISQKTLLFPLLSFVSLGGVVGLGAVALVNGLQTQLLNQVKSQLSVTEISYNIKIDQMGFGFRGQSDNAAIIAAARNRARGEDLESDLRSQVKGILQNEIKAREIEYATLVGKDLRIIVNANADRVGETFDPNNLVSNAFKNPQQIKTSEIVSWGELSRESPPLPKGIAQQDALIRYTVTPVKDPDTGKAIAALVSGDIVNGKLPIIQRTVDASLRGSYSAIYLRKPTGEFALASSLEKQDQQDAKPNVPLSDVSLLSEAAKTVGQPVARRTQIGNKTYTVAARALANSDGKPVAVLVYGDPEIAIAEIIRRSLLLQLGLSILVLAAIVVLAATLGRAIAEPVKRLQRIAREFSQGNYQTRAEVSTADEVGQLASTFNELADSIEINTERLKESRQLAENLAEEQRQLKEEVQKRALELLMEVDPISKGDLTIRAKVTADEIGTIADAYNATVGNLRKIVTQVQSAATQVAETTNSNETSVRSLSVEALRQAEEIAAALERAQEMAQLVQLVASNAKQAETAVKQAATTVQEGDAAMNRTVDGILSIRETVAETAKKVKHLGESSQKISTVVNLISTFAAQTNLLALNASIEAARAGEEGRGFAVVADEVRSLARQSAEATSEIEKLVAAIQAETNEVVAAMEAGTEQVVTGTRLVDETRQSLNKITAASTEIEQLVEAIARATVVQTQASEAVTQTMTNVAEIADKTSKEASLVSSSFEQLRHVAVTLQENVGRFKVR